MDWRRRRRRRRRRRWRRQRRRRQRRRRYEGGRWVPDDGVGDQVSRTWSRTRQASVRGMKRLRERDVGQILFPPTSRRRNMTARERMGRGREMEGFEVEARGGYTAPLLL